MNDAGAKVRHHRRRRLAQGRGGSAEGQRRRRAAADALGGEGGGGLSGPARRRQRGTEGRAVAASWSPPSRPLRAGVGGQRAPAVHPLHLRLHRESPRACCTPPAATAVNVSLTTRWVFDLQGRRRLLVHRRRGLGDRAQLRGLRTADERRHVVHVRGRADHPRAGPLLGDDRAAQGHHLLHRAHRHPRLHAAGRRASPEARPVRRCACWARWASRSTPRRGCGTARSSAAGAARSSTPGGRPRPGRS